MQGQSSVPSPSCASARAPGQDRPARRVVQRRQDGVVGLALADLAAVDHEGVGCRGWRAARSKAAPGSPPLRNGQLRSGRAVGQERVERALEADDLAAGLVEDVAVRVDGAVDHHRPHRLREHRGVGGAQLAAVGEAEVADLLLAQRLADLVHVPGRVLRGDVREDARRCWTSQRAAEVLGRVDERLLLGRRVGRRVER